MRKVRIVVVLGWVGFLYHICAGIAFYALADLTATYLNTAFPAGGFNYLFPKMMAILFLPIGLAYLLAAIDQDASRSLLMVATCEKILFVLYALAGYFSGTVNDYILGGVILEGIFALVGIYAVVVARKQKGVN